MLKTCILYIQLTLPLQNESVLYSRQFIDSKMNQLICSRYRANADNISDSPDPCFNVSSHEGLTPHTVCCGVKAVLQKAAK